MNVFLSKKGDGNDYSYMYEKNQVSQPVLAFTIQLDFAY